MAKSMKFSCQYNFKPRRQLDITYVHAEAVQLANQADLIKKKHLAWSDFLHVSHYLELEEISLPVIERSADSLS